MNPQNAVETVSSKSGSAMTVPPAPPPGLEALYQACRSVYPDQPNPLQVSTLIKYWLGGMDPLDYISMYSNPGDSQLHVPSHWHYITFGLSDLHGDGRVHEKALGSDQPSGYGFELTFRLKREHDETSPPVWPANLLQALAKYVFHSGESMVAGDHISWHSTLDYSDSIIRHMLLASDPQLPPVVRTPNGTVSFIQVVGVCQDELRAAQRWNGLGVLDIMRKSHNGGGPWLVTDMRRGESMLDVDPTAAMIVDRGVEEDGSNLSGVSASVLAWFSPSLQQTGFCKDAEYESSLGSGPWRESGLTELSDPKVLPDLVLTLALEPALIITNVALRGRLKHGRHFTVKCVSGGGAVTLVPETVSGSLTAPDRPFVARGPWLHILIQIQFVQCMLDKLSQALNKAKVELPLSIEWPERGLTIKVVHEVTPPSLPPPPLPLVPS